MDLREIGMDPVFVDALHELLDLPDETPDTKSSPHTPSRAYIREKKAMAATPADVLEYPDSYVFVLDMPGLKQDQIKVQVEEGNLLVVSGERKRTKAEKEHVKYVRMERRLGKYLKKFALNENADTENITAAYRDGVLTVTVKKRPPPEQKPIKTIEVQIG